MFWVPSQFLSVSAVINIDLEGYPRLAFHPQCDRTVKIVPDEPLKEEIIYTPVPSWVNAQDIFRVNNRVRQFWRGIDQVPFIMNLARPPSHPMAISMWGFGSKILLLLWERDFQAATLSMRR